MRRALHKIFGGGAASRFLEADFAETTQPLENPLRGWYSVYTFEAEQEPDLKELEHCLDREETLALVLIDIGAFGDRDLDCEALERIRSILRFFASHGRDMILRAAYDHEGRGMEREPSQFSQVLRHMEQIGEIVGQFHREIFLYQGLLVGSWGEMHSSRFLSQGHLARLADVLRGCAAGGTFLAVRRPVFWRMLNGMDNPGDMGLFDDGIFGSDSHLGTFGGGTKEGAGEWSAWCREEELAFEESLCRTVPNGGEAVYGEGYWETLGQKQMLNDLGRMHVTYLNSRHDPALLERWKETVYEGPGLWKGKPLYQYVGAHLGYRFLVKGAQARWRAGGLLLRIAVENAGFAGLYREAVLYLERLDSQGNTQRERLDYDLRGLGSGETDWIECAVKADEGALFLRAELAQDERPIYFANFSRRDGGVCLGSLQGKDRR